MILLSIETSCDESAVAILDATDRRRVFRSSIIASQISTHQAYGGVVPEVAAREHILHIIPCLQQALQEARMKPSDLDVLAVTAGPGLVTSLRVGVQTAKALSYAWNCSLVGVNHIEGHLYAHWHESQQPKLPALALVVSGGHTELLYMPDHRQYVLVGRTRDDAAGEAFDKVAKLLGLGYPGGPAIEKAARDGSPNAFDLPRPMLHETNHDFSFAGLKTAVLYLIRNNFKNRPVPTADIAASFQAAAVDVLVEKTVRALTSRPARSLLLSGGVAANSLLRLRLNKALAALQPAPSLYVPPLHLCTDNAAMIALAGYYRARAGELDSWKTLEADPNWELV